MLHKLALFLLLVVLQAGIDGYIYSALLSVKLNLVEKKRKWFSYFWWGYSILLILAVIFSFYFDLKLTIKAIILAAFFLSFITKLCFIPFLLLDDIRRKILAYREKNNNTPNKHLDDDKAKIPRSEFLVKAGIAVAAIPLATLSWGIVSNAYDYQVIRRKLYLKNLPKGFNGLRIAQFSDIHSGSFYNKTAVKGGVELLLAERPDVIFFTGDLINNKASEMRDYQDLFTKVKAPLGVFSILGNHDYGNYYYGDEPSPAKTKNFEDLVKTHKLMGWDLLLDEHRRLRVNNEEIGILGCQNWGKGRIQKGDLVKTLKGTEDLPVKVLLSHDPSHWREQILNHSDIDVTFSGHTHGMQFGVRADDFQWSPVEYIYKEWAGLYQVKNQQLYVNVGYGFLGYPGRVGILPEITIFDLQAV